MSKPAICNNCREVIFDRADQFERREEILRTDRQSSRLRVRRVEILCRRCARDLAYEWKGLRNQSALFAQDGEPFV